MTERYGEYEQVNGATVNAALDRADSIEAERDQAWAELRSIREAINANPEESTLDEVQRIYALAQKAGVA